MTTNQPNAVFNLDRDILTLILLLNSMQ